MGEGCDHTHIMFPPLHSCRTTTASCVQVGTCGVPQLHGHLGVPHPHFLHKEIATDGGLPGAQHSQQCRCAGAGVRKVEGLFPPNCQKSDVGADPEQPPQTTTTPTRPPTL